MKTMQQILFGVVVMICAVACNSPTLPLPPPTQSAIEAHLDTAVAEATVTGRSRAVEPDALVACYNNRTGTGVVVQANADGAFSARLEAQDGDTIEVWQRVGNDPPSIAIKTH